METTFKLTLSLEGIESPAVALRELQQWLDQAGIRQVELIPGPAVEGELAWKEAIALSVAFSIATEFAHLPPSVAEGLREIHKWQQQRPVQMVVIHPTGQSERDKEIQQIIDSIEKREQKEPHPETVDRHQPPHIEVREPKKSPRTKNLPSANSQK